MPQSRGPGPCGLRGSLLPLAAGIRSSYFGRVGKGNQKLCETACQTKTEKEEQKERMAIIKAPPKQPKSVTIQVRVEESVKTQLDQYAKFIDSTPSYVITEALKVLFKRDDEFKTWLGQHSSNGKIQELIGGGFKETV
jgi:hypothetical protein